MYSKFTVVLTLVAAAMANGLPLDEIQSKNVNEEFHPKHINSGQLNVEVQNDLEKSLHQVWTDLNTSDKLENLKNFAATKMLQSNTQQQQQAWPGWVRYESEAEVQSFDEAVEYYRGPTNDFTTLNGKLMSETVPIAPTVDVIVLLDTIDAFGNRILQQMSTRKARTRVGIHMHKYGGFTTVLQGEITDFIEGMTPVDGTRFGTNTAYYMPPNVPMSATNLGDVDALLVDTFILPPGEDYINILEPMQ